MRFKKKQSAIIFKFLTLESFPFKIVVSLISVKVVS